MLLPFVGFLVATTAHSSPPVIDYQPQSQTVILYQQAAFGVIAHGTLPLTYQWLKNGLPIPGATYDQLSFPQPQFSDEAKYSVVVSNSEGSDFLSFDAAGLNGIDFLQDEVEYGARTWHTNQEPVQLRQQPSVTA